VPARPAGPVGPGRWIRDLLLGARLALAGGREGWLRTVLTAVGVGLGVVLLLGAASISTMQQARGDRETARDDTGTLVGESQSASGDATMFVGNFDADFRDISIRGRILQPEGPKAPVPPGLAALPGPGKLVVSPALARLLASPDGVLLRPRLNYPVVGTIGPAGLSGPNEYAFYLGSDRLSGEQGSFIRSIDHFGNQQQHEPLGSLLVLLVIIIFVVLLLPIAMFITAAVRFGGDQRDRRLAALRLVGADAGMARRIAAGEALFSSTLGVLLGVALFLIGRQLVEPITLWDISAFPADIRPSPLLGLVIVLAVPAAAVAVTLLALRRVVIEPLGVVRQAAGARRRLWWRLLLPAVGLALLYPLFHHVTGNGAAPNEYQVALGASLLLVGVTAVLPWLIEAVVGRLGGGSLPWQLAVRRLQLSSGTSARAVNGVAVAAAGAIALQMLFGVAQQANTRSTGADPSRIQVEVSLAGATDGAEAATMLSRFEATPGVHSGLAMLNFTIYDQVLSQTHPQGDQPGQWALTVADCATLREMAVVDACADGDVFQVDNTDNPPASDAPRPGQRVTIGDPDDGNPPLWTMPRVVHAARSRADPSGIEYTGTVATPGAIAPALLRSPNIEIDLRADLSSPDTVERIRNAAASVDPLTQVYVLQATSQSNRFSVIRRGLFIGMLATLLLIGVSLLVGTLEQLRERRRLLAVLVAFGTRRTTLSWSVLFQTAIPMVLGMVLAAVTGSGLGAVLLVMVGEPVRLDWSSIGAISAVTAAVVLLVTALSLPPLWRMMRPEGLRTE
jgi:ABC-type antimicrobial peptide transport system permease subunit